MIITMIASFTDEQALILAKEKGYSETINGSLDPTTPEFVPNPQTPGEFIKNFYEQTIIEDATKEFMKYKERTYIEDQRKQMQEDTRNEVVASISSSIE